MEKKKVFIAYYIIGSAIIWGFTILGCAWKLKGTDCYDQIQTIIGLAAGIHLILIWGPLSFQLLKKT